MHCSDTRFYVAKLKLLMINETVNGVIDNYAILFRVERHNKIIHIRMNVGQSVFMAFSFLDEVIKIFSNPSSIST